MAKEFTYKMNIDAEIGGLTTKLKTVKDALASVTNEGKEPKLAKILDSLASKLDGLKTKASTPIRSEAAFGSMEKDIQSIDRLLENLSGELSALSKKSAAEKISFLPPGEQKRLLALVAAMQNYDKAIDATTKKSKELVAAEREEQKAKGNLEKINAKLAANKDALATAQFARKNAEAALAEANARQEAAKAAEEQYARIQKLASAAKAADSSVDLRKATFDDGEGNDITLAKARANRDKAAAAAAADDLGVLRDALNQTKGAADNASAAIGRAETAVIKQTAAVQAASAKVKDLTGAYEASKITDAANAFAEFRRAAQDLGVSLDGIGADNTIENINALKQRINECVETGVAPANEAIHTSIEAQGELVIQTKKTSDAIGENVKQFRAENEQAGQVDGIMNRIKQFTGLTGVALVMRRALQSAINTTKELDKQMTAMAVVTDLDVGDYWKQLPEHTEQANKLGVAIKDVYEAETLYYQQGLKTAQVQKLSTSTLKMARIAGLSAEDATNKMTAALRGFNMEINETNADRIADVYSKLAAITASDVQEISTAMTKTASLASNAGMEFETTAAFLAQIIETTRESAETAGTALKTVIARFQELKKSPDEIGEVEGEIVDANKIETALRSVDVALRDTQGQFRDLDDVFMDLSAKWDSLDTNTQRYIATIAAGSRQQSRFIAMMSDYSRTSELVNAANNAAGASNEQFEKTLESLQSKIAQLKNAWDTFTQGLANNEFIKFAVDLLTGLMTAVNAVTKGFGPWSSSALKIGMVTAALIAGDKALKIFTTSLKQNGSVLGAFGDIFKSAAGGIKTFSANLVKNIKLLKTGQSVIISDVGAIERRRVAQAKAIIANNQVKAAEEGLNKLRSQEKIDVEAVKKQEDLLRITKDQSAVANEALIKTQEEEAIALGLSATQQEVYNTMVGAGVTEETAAVLAKAGLTTASWANMQAAYGEAAATHASELAQKLQNVGLIKGTIIKWNDQIATIAQAAANGTYTGSAIAATVAQWAMNIAVWAGCPPLAALALIILVVVAAIALLVLAIIGIVAAFKKMAKESPEGQFKAAEESLKAASEQAQLASEAYKELKSSLADLRTRYDALDEMVVGTQEWRDALLEVNDQVMDLIDKYPQLADEITTDSNGVMRISEETMRKVEDQAANTVAQANNAKLAATIRRNQAADQLRFSKLSDRAVAGNEALGTLAGLKSGAAIGMLGPGGASIAGTAGATLHGAGSGRSWVDAISTGLGGPIGGAIVGAFEGHDISRALHQGITDAFARSLATEGIDYNDDGSINQEAMRERMQKLGLDEVTITEWMHTLTKNSGEAAKELEKYGMALEQSTAANKAAMQTMISNSLAMVDSSKYASEQIKQMGELGIRVMQKSIDEANATVEKASKDKDLDKDADYLAYWEGIYGAGNVKIDKRGAVQVKNDQGKFEDKVNKEDALDAYATAKASEDYAKKAQLLPKVLQQAAQSVQGFGKTLDHVFNDDEGMGIAREDLEKLSVQALTDLWNSSDELKKIYSSYDEFLQEMQDRTEKARQAFTQNQEALNSLGMGDFTFDKTLTSGTEKGLVDHMRQVVAVSGPEVGKELGNSINNLLSSVALEDREKLAAQLNAIDWHDANALEDLPATLKELGLALPEDQLQAFIEQAKTAADAIHSIDLTKLNEELIKINNTLKSMRLNDQDRTFESDAYEAIISANADLKSYFKQDLEGNFIFLGSNMSILTDAVLKNTDALVAERAEILENSKNARVLMDDLANSGQTLSSGSLTDAKNWSIWTDNERKEFIQTFINNANTRGNDLSGINANLSNDTDVGTLNKEQVKSILQSLISLGTVQSIQKEIDNEVIQARVTAMLRENASLNTFNSYASQIRKGSALDIDAEASFKASRQALLIEARNNGVSEQDLKLLAQYNELLLKYEDAHLTNTKEYRDFVKQAAAATRDLQTRSSFQTMYEGMKQNVNEANELVEAYNKTTSALEQRHLVAQMVREFELEATEENQALYESYVDAMIHGEEVGLENLINLSGYAITGGVEAYTRMGEQTLDFIENELGASYLEFMRKMENAGYGWVEQVEEGVEVWHWGMAEAMEIADDLGKKIDGWLNPYDWLYNSNQQINAQLIERERLERRWSNALEDNNLTVSEMSDTLAGEVAITRQVASEYEDIYNNAAEQVREFVDYVNTQGLPGFADAFAIGPNGQIVADKEALFAANLSADAGGLGEEEIDRITGLIDTMRDAEDQINEANSYLREIQKTGKDEYNDLVDRITDALRQQYQREIDTLSTINDTISDAASTLVDKLQEKIDDDRKAREDEKARQQLTDKQTQLAYLQASGGSALEILQLQKEIGDNQQSYTDSLVDSAVEEMTRANQQAADQRQEQIDIAQAQYDFWSDYEAVHDAEEVLNASLIDIAQGQDPTKTGMADLLAYEENRQAKTTAAIADWDKELGISSKLATIFAGVNPTATEGSVQSKITTTNASLDTLNSSLTTGLSQTTAAANSVGAKFKDYTAGNTQLLTKENLQTLTNTTTTDSKAQEKWWADKLAGIENLVTTILDKGGASHNSGEGGKSGDNAPDFQTPSSATKGSRFNEIQEWITAHGLREGDRNRWGQAFAHGTLSDGTNVLDAYRSLSENERNSLIGADKGAAVTSMGIEFSKNGLITNGLGTAIWNENDVAKDKEEDGDVTIDGTKYHGRVKGKDNDASAALRFYASAVGVDPSTYNHQIMRFQGRHFAIFNGAAYELVDFKKEGYKSFLRYAGGGLADYTGPAWLDGTKSSPELVLNQTDTANFIELKNVLADLLKNNNGNSTGMGNNYYDIDVHVDSIESDYDIDSAAARMRELIEDDAMYRNVNAIQQIR